MRRHRRLRPDTLRLIPDSVLDAAAYGGFFGRGFDAR
jgi:hypothetical protein